MKSRNEPKPWYKRFWVWLIIIIVLIIIGGALGGDKTPSSSNTSDGNSAQDTSKVDEKREFAVGETADIDDRKLSITEVQRNYDTGNQFAQPESGKEFVIITVSIENNGDNEINYNTFDFKLQDSNGVQQNEDYMALSEGKLNSGSLAAGGKVTGKLAYQVPKDDAGLKLLFTNPSLFNNKTITFSL